MKKLLMAVMMFTAVTIFSGITAQAAYTERTDEYALDYYKYSAYSDDKYIKAEAQKITAGLTTEYEKAQAIYQWAWDNMVYTNDIPDGLTGIDEYKYGVCWTFANTTMYLAQAAGLPAKVVTGYLVGGINGHAWCEIYVDSRWLCVDAANGIFDKSRSLMYKNYEYSIKTQDEEAWTGSLYFVDIDKDKVLKEVKNFPLNGLVTSTYGFDIKNLYTNPYDMTKLTLNTFKVDSQHSIIYVKQVKKYTVSLKSNGKVIKTLTVNANSKIAKPATPTRKGYKFVGWYKTSSFTKAWNFNTDKVTKNTIIYAKWQKK